MTYIPIVKIDIGRTSGGVVDGWSDGSAFSVSGTTATASPTGGWDVSGCIEAIPQNVCDTIRYGSVGFTIGGLIPFASYTLRLFTGWEAVSQTFTVTINGHSHGSLTNSVIKKITEARYQICADIDGNIIVTTSGSPFAILNAAILSRAENDFANAMFDGNSITKVVHTALPSDWHGDWGMAASRLENDYVHKLAAKFATPPAVFPYYDRDWEVAHQTFDLTAYDARYSPMPDLIVIRLGENVPFDGTLSTYQADFESLIAYHRTKAPHARIVVTSNFWDDATKDADQEAAAKAQHVLWVALPGLHNGTHEIAIGDPLFGYDGTPYLADGVLVPHPNDVGMQAIADLIWDALPTPVTETQTNWALASNGGVATASSTISAPDPLDHPPARVNDGYRNTNNVWDDTATPGGAWKSATNTDEWLRIALDGPHDINEIDVITMEDSVTYTTDPTLADTFASYGLTDFTVQYSQDNGSTWTDVEAVTANDKVWRKFTFDTVTGVTDVRISGCHSSVFSACVVVEFEAWGPTTAGLAISTASPLPSGTVGIDYHATLAASGFTGFVGFEKASGDAAVSIADDGTVTMTAPAAGTYSFVARVEDSDGVTATKSFTITITEFAWPFGDELKLDGLEVDGYTYNVERLTCGFGQGYGAASSTGSGSGLWGWEITSDCLPDAASYGNEIEGLPRFEYYRSFIADHTEGGSNEVFWIQFRTGKKFHASFDTDSVSGTMHTLDLFSMEGVKLKFRRIPGTIYNDDGSIFEPFAWVRADAITGKSDGDSMAGSWADYLDAPAWTVASNGTTPTYETNEVNTLPIVRLTNGNVQLAGDGNYHDIFVVAKVSEATFSAARGMISDNAGEILVGTNSSTKFADPATGIEYRLNGTLKTSGNCDAPMNVFGVIHLRATDAPIGVESFLEFARSNAGVAGKCDIAEIIIPTNADSGQTQISAATFARITNVLKRRYAIT